MNKSLWHSDIFRAACASVALHAGIAGVMVLSISMAAPHFFRFVESSKVLHVSWISAQMDLAEPEGIIKKVNRGHRYHPPSSLQPQPCHGKNRTSPQERRRRRDP